MQKTLTFIGILFCLSLSSYATNVSGHISANTTWTKSGNPYIITGTTYVDSNYQLTVDPGVVIRIDSGCSLHVYGKLKMEGSATDTITITTNVPNPVFKPGYVYYSTGIYFENTNNLDTISISYCHFSHLDDALNVILDRPLKITNSVLDSCITGIVSQRYVYADRCKLDNCHYKAIQAAPYHVTNCSISNSEYGLSGYWHVDDYCANNLIYDNSTGIIHCDTVINNIIIGNRIRGTEECYYISNNLILYNKIGIEMTGFAVIYNCIEYNDVGIYNTHFTPTHGMKVNNNCIAFNYTNDFITDSSPIIDATDNYWGTIDSATIESHIIDSNDNSYRARAIIVPFLYSADSACDTIIVPTHIINAFPKPSVVSVYPNPVSSTFTVDAGDKMMMEVSVYDIKGTLVAHTITDKNRLTVDASSLSKGMYLYRVRLKDESVVLGKVMKE
ncbi:MAG: T9SS type A sorting domain-containing protein [Bacteroidetes bacterium]|nr:T9SS type A sorting domain-containing protein [Bacteroidota bacterium]